MQTLKYVYQAKNICHGLSRPEKLRDGKKQFALAYNIPAIECKIGSLLAKIKNTVCSNCYALKNRYVFPNVIEAMYRRFNSLKNPLWTDAMVLLINKQSKDYFRWHDSGSIQDINHLQNIINVCKRTPKTKHWIPVREYLILREYRKQYGEEPVNVCFRISDHYIGQADDTIEEWKKEYTTSGVTRDKSKATCPAHRQGNQCRKCRACWDRNVKRVVYPFH